MVVFDKLQNLKKYSYISKEMDGVGKILASSSFSSMQSGIYSYSNAKAFVDYVVKSPKGTLLKTHKEKFKLIALMEESEMVRVDDSYFLLDSSHFLLFSDESEVREAIGEYDKMPIKRIFFEF